MTKTTLIITTRDRPQFLQLVVETAFKQTRPFHQIIISDNSSSKHFKTRNKIVLIPYLRKYCNRLKLFPTPQDLPSDTHTKYIQDNYVGKTEFCVIFHDDDELLPHYHETVLGIFNTRQDVVAVGCNALILKDRKLIPGSVMRQRKGTKLIRNQYDLLKSYMEIGPFSPPPLSGYIFKSQILKSISFDSSIGGKYSDVVALNEAARLGNIVWICKPLIQYRFHSNQNSQKVSTLDFRNLLNYMVKKGEFSSDSIYVQSYRFKHFRLKFKSFLKSGKWHSAKVVSIYLIHYTLRKLIWRKQTYEYFWSKITHK